MSSSGRAARPPWVPGGIGHQHASPARSAGHCGHHGGQRGPSASSTPPRSGGSFSRGTSRLGSEISALLEQHGHEQQHAGAPANARRRGGGAARDGVQLSVVTDIISTAELISLQAGEPSESVGTGDIPLTAVLKAHAIVMRRHQLPPERDTGYYRFVLKLAEQPEVSWWSKFDAVCGRYRSRAAAEDSAVLEGWSSPGGRSAEFRSSDLAFDLDLSVSSPIGSRAWPANDEPSGAADDDSPSEFQWVATCFRNWTRYVDHRRRRTAEYAQALARWSAATDYWSINTAAKVFRCWQRYTRSRAAKDLAMECFLGRTQRAAFDRLHAHSVLSRLSRGALRHWQAGTVARAFVTWRWNIHQRKYSAKALGMWSSTLLRRVFATWRGNAQAQRRVAHTLALALVRMSNVKLSAALSDWRAASRRRLEGRRVLHCTLAVWGVRYCVMQAFQKWAGAVQHTVALAQLAERLQNEAATRLARKFLLKWEVKTRQRDSVRHFCGLMRNRDTARALQSWKIFVAGKQKLDAVARQVEVLRALAVVELQWVQWVQAYVFRRRLVQSMLHWQRGAYAAAFRAWRSSTDRKTYLRSVLMRSGKRMKLRTLTTAFNAWYDRAQDSRAAKEKLSMVLRRMGNTKQRVVFHQWRSVAVEACDARWELVREMLREMRDHCSAEQERRQQQALECLRKLVRSRSDLIFRMWKGYVVRSMKLRSAVLALGLRSVSDSFDAWKHTTVDLAQQRKQHIRRAMAWWRCASSIKAFRAWWQFTRNRLTMRAALAHRDTLLMSRVLTAWVRSRRKQIREAACIARIVMRLTGKAFLGWRNNARSSRNERRVGQSIRRIQQMLIWKCLHKWHESASESALSRRRVKLAFILWSSLAADTRQNEDLVRRAVARLMDATKAAALFTWQDWARTQIKSRRCLLHMLNRRVAAALHGWRTAVAAQVASRATATNMILRMQNRVLASALQSWIAFTERRCDVRDIGKQVKLRADHTVLAKFWEIWDVEQDHCHKLRRGLAIMSHGAIFRCFSRWAEHTAEAIHQRQLVSKSVSRLLNRRLASAFDSWCSFTSQRLRLHALQDRVSKLHASYLKRHYWDVYATQFGNQVKARRFLRRMMFSEAHAALKTWKANVDELIHRRMLLQSAVQRMQNRQLAKAFDSWLEWLTLTQRRLGAAEDVGRMLETRCRQQAWDEWKRAFSLSRTFTRAVMSLKNAKAKQALNQWSFFVAESKRLREVATHILRRVSNRVLVLAFESWQAGALAEKQEFALKSRAAQRIFNRCVAMAFSALWDYRLLAIERRNTLARHVAVLKSGTMVRVIDAWASWVNTKFDRMEKGYELSEHVAERLQRQMWQRWTEQYDRKLVAKHAINMMANRHIGKAYRAWDSYVQTRAMLRFVLKRYANKTLAAAFATWFGSLARFWEHQRHQLSVCLRLMMHKHLTLCFTAWVRWRARILEVREVAVKRMRLHGVWKMFAAWHRFAAGRLDAWDAGRIVVERRGFHAEKQFLEYWVCAYVLARFQAVLRAGKLHRAFLEWKDVTENLNYQRDELQRSVGHMANVKLAQVFNSWHSNAQRSSYVKQAANRSLHRWLGHITERAFTAWKQFCSRSQELKFLESRLHELVSQEVAMHTWQTWRSAYELRVRLRPFIARVALGGLARAFDAWAEMVEDLKGARAALKHWQDGTLMSALMGWISFTDLQIQKKEKVASSLKFWRKRELAYTFYGWKDWHSWHVSHKARMRRIVSAFQHRDLGRAFRSWKETAQEKSARHAKCNSIMSIVHEKLRYDSLMNVLRAWEELTVCSAEHRHAKNRAAELACDRVQAWAFVAWVKRTKHGLQKRADIAAAQALLRVHRLTDAFDTLADYAESRAQKSLLADLARTQRVRTVLSRSFDHWVNVVAENKDALQKSIAADDHHAAVTEFQAFKIWVEFTRWSFHLRLCETAAAEHRFFFALPIYVRAWRTFTDRMRLARALHSRVEYANSGAAWDQWIRVMHIRHGLRKFVENKRWKHFSNVMFIWQEWASNSRAKRIASERASAFWYTKACFKALHAFRLGALRVLRLRLAANQIEQTRMQRVLSGKWGLWKAELYSALSEADGLQLAAAHRRRVLLEQSIGGWEKLALWQHHVRSFSGTIRHRTLAKYFSAWSRFAETQSKLAIAEGFVQYRVNQRLAKRCLAVWVYRALNSESSATSHQNRVQLRQSWLFWQAHTKAQQMDHRTVADISSVLADDEKFEYSVWRCVMRWQNFALWPAFHRWQSACLHRAARRGKRSVASQQYVSRTLSKGLAALAENKHHSRIAAAVDAYATEHLLSASIRRWKQAALEFKHERLTHFAAYVHFRRRTLSEAFSTWANASYPEGSPFPRLLELSVSARAVDDSEFWSEDTAMDALWDGVARLRLLRKAFGGLLTANSLREERY